MFCCATQEIPPIFSFFLFFSLSSIIFTAFTIRSLISRLSQSISPRPAFPSIFRLSQHNRNTYFSPSVACRSSQLNSSLLNHWCVFVCAAAAVVSCCCACQPCRVIPRVPQSQPQCNCLADVSTRVHVRGCVVSVCVTGMLYY